jgi:hypothetical protein
MAQTSEQTQDEQLAEALVEFQAADTAYVNALEAVGAFLRANQDLRSVYFGQAGPELVIKNNPELQRLIADSEFALDRRNSFLSKWAALKSQSGGKFP